MVACMGGRPQMGTGGTATLRLHCRCCLTHMWHPHLLTPSPPCCACCAVLCSVVLQVGEAEKELGGAAATNPFAQLVDEAEGLDKIEDLQVGAVLVN